jgi:hypothetical protein
MPEGFCLFKTKNYGYGNDSKSLFVKCTDRKQKAQPKGWASS